MTPVTCIALRHFSKTIQCDELKLAADVYILQHFKQVSSTDEFCKLAYNQVQSEIYVIIIIYKYRNHFHLVTQ